MPEICQYLNKPNDYRLRLYTTLGYLSLENCEVIVSAKTFSLSLTLHSIFFVGALFSAVSSMEMLAVFVASFIFNAVYPVVNDRGHPGAIFYLVDGMLLLPFAFNL